MPQDLPVQRSPAWSGWVGDARAVSLSAYGGLRIAHRASLRDVAGPRSAERALAALFAPPRIADRVEPAGLVGRWPARGAGGFAMGGDGADSGR